MSNLSKKQFSWSKHHDEQSGITWHTHGDSGHKVYNTLYGRYRWQIEGGRKHGELHTSLGDAKKVVETAHEESK